MAGELSGDAIAALNEGQRTFGAIQKAQVAAGATKLQTEQDWAWALKQAADREKNPQVKHGLMLLADEVLGIDHEWWESEDAEAQTA